MTRKQIIEALASRGMWNSASDRNAATRLSDAQLIQCLDSNTPPSKLRTVGRVGGSVGNFDVHKLSQERGIAVDTLIHEHKRLRDAGEVD